MEYNCEKMNKEVGLKSIEIVVKGRVQGVGYRAFAVKVAQSLNVKGYVRNLPDGNVLCLAKGESENLCLFVKKLSKGPLFAYVKDVVTTEITSKDDYEDFTVVY